MKVVEHLLATGTVFVLEQHQRKGWIPDGAGACGITFFWCNDTVDGTDI